MPKHASDTSSPSLLPAKGSPKKAKTPPKKAKEEQMLKCGLPCKIQFYHVAEFLLWRAIYPEDKSDAFMKNITYSICNDMSCGLREKFDFKGDVVRRVSLTVNKAMKNHRKSFECKFIVQSNDNESVERNLATARELKKVIMSVLHSIAPLHLILLFVLF